MNVRTIIVRRGRSASLPGYKMEFYTTETHPQKPGWTNIKLGSYLTENQIRAIVIRSISVARQQKRASQMESSRN